MPTGEQLPLPFTIDDVVAGCPGLSLDALSRRSREPRRSGSSAAGRRGGSAGSTTARWTRSRWRPWNPSPLVTFGLTGERNVGRLPAGDFAQTLFGVRTRFNFSSDLQLNSFIQYDNDSQSVGSNTRLRWTFNPAGDMFVIYNHNIRDITDRWNFDSNQLLIKLQYHVQILGAGGVA